MYDTTLKQMAKASSALTAKEKEFEAVRRKMAASEEGKNGELRSLQRALVTSEAGAAEREQEKREIQQQVVVCVIGWLLLQPTHHRLAPTPLVVRCYLENIPGGEIVRDNRHNSIPTDRLIGSHGHARLRP